MSDSRVLFLLLFLLQVGERVRNIERLPKEELQPKAAELWRREGVSTKLSAAKSEVEGSWGSPDYHDTACHKGPKRTRILSAIEVHRSRGLSCISMPHPQFEERSENIPL